MTAEASAFAAFAHELVAAHASAGVGSVSAPVLGRPDVAAGGELDVLAAGPGAALDRVRPVFDVIGSLRVHMRRSRPAG